MASPKMTYYKAVRVSRGKRRSLFVSQNSKLSTIYEPGQWAVAPVGGLYVWSSLECAKWWIEGFKKTCEIWEVDVKEPRSIDGFPDHTSCFRQVMLVGQVI